MKRFSSALALAAVMTAAPAWAVAKGGSLYIKCATAKLLKEPKAAAAKVSDLAEGDEVVWNGAAAKPYHDVQSKKAGKQGFVDASCLSPSKPASEYATGGGAINAEAFKSSGAATKGLSQGAITYANEKPADVKKNAAQIIWVEENTKVKTDPNDKGFHEWAKKQGVNFSAGKVAAK
jgi:hypothetical protein